MNNKSNLHPSYEAIREYVDTLHIIDTHEHLLKNNADWAACVKNPHWDILTEYLQHYMSSDLRSAGLSAADLEKVKRADTPVEDRWAVVEPYWNAARHTGYTRCLDLAVRDLHGLPGLTRDTIREANKKFKASADHPDWYGFVFKEKSKIAMSLLDCNLDCDPRFFRSVFQLGNYFMPRSVDNFKNAEFYLKAPVHCFEDWLDATVAEIDYCLAKGAVAYKNAMAYARTLAVEQPTRHEAELAFNDVARAARVWGWNVRPEGVPKALQDYMLRFIFNQLSKRGVPVQIHTGILEGNANMLDGANPMLLCNLFMEYPEIKFDIFHMGYPWQQELSALAKMFPNVHIDLCWGHIISPAAAQRALVEWLDAVPANKINAFGGDYRLPDGVYGHQLMARHNVSVSLAQKVGDGVFDVDEAKRVAKMLFVDNPAKLFKLEKQSGTF